MISLVESSISALAFLKQPAPSPDRELTRGRSGIRNESNRAGVIQNRSQVVSVVSVAVP